MYDSLRQAEGGGGSSSGRSSRQAVYFYGTRHGQKRNQLKSPCLPAYEYKHIQEGPAASPPKSLDLSAMPSDRAAKHLEPRAVGAVAATEVH